MNGLSFDKSNVNTAGIISINNWTMAKDGLRYMYFYCDRWEIITDKEIPVEGFRSVERWQLIAVDINGNVLAIFPGCQIKAYLFCNSVPEHSESGCYGLK